MTNSCIESFGNIKVCCTNNSLMIKKDDIIIKKLFSIDSEFLQEAKLEFLESLSRHKDDMGKLESKIAGLI